MLIEGIRGGEDQSSVVGGAKSLIVLGIATSIDALSVGLTIADYGSADAVLCSAVIGAVTYVICLAGIFLGRKIGSRLAGKAGMLGGIILIAIGIEVFVKGVIK
jgi:putative Mn2+ efflux pump MntP